MLLKLALTLSLLGLSLSALAAEVQPLQPHNQSVVANTKATVTTRRFSINYPNHWFVTDNHNNYVIIYNQPLPQRGGGEAPPYMIKTDISVQQTSLQEALRSYDDEPDQVRRIEEVTINGRLGVRIWQESSGFAFPNVIITYVPVSNSEVAYVVSFYSAENQAAERAIIQMQNTFRVF